jgi:ABC-type phosphate transport system substrate-binding protein
MVNRKTASAIAIAALFACAIPPKSAASLLMAPVIAQTAPSFSVPDSVAKGTKLTVASSSDNMNAISKTLGQGFEKQYSGKVDITTASDANKAIEEVLNGNVDLAAISRPLSEAEKKKGLIEVPARREKIAIIVGKDNPFAQSITGSQFAQIFRGEIKDWSKVGGTAGPIRVIDRPEASETRQALKPYPVFATAEFKTGATATQLSEDSIQSLAKELGKDGIGYALVSQLEGQSDIKAIPLHKTLPDDPRYPFSQPYSFVYAGGASPAVTAFLGYATGAPGQSALKAADLSGYGVLPAAGTATAAAGTNAGTAGTTGATGSEGAAGAGANGAAGNSPNTAADGNAVGDAAGNGNAAVEGESGAAPAQATGAVAAQDGLSDVQGRWWWLLLPLAGLGLLLWAAGKRGAEEETGYIANTGESADDGIRSSYHGVDAPDTRFSDARADARVNSVDLDSVGLDLDIVGSSAGQSSRPSSFSGPGTTGLGSVVAGGAALAGGAAAAAAAAGSGLAGRIKGQTGDVTMDLGNIPGSGQGDMQGRIQRGTQGGTQGGIESAQGTVKGGLGNLRSNIQGSVQGGIEGDRTRIQGGIDSARDSDQGGFDGIRSNFQEGVDGVRESGSEAVAIAG